MHLNPQFILRTIADETILISIQDITKPKQLLILNELGTDIYTLLQKGKSVEQIRATLLSQYEVGARILDADMNDFLSALKAYGVLID